MDATQFIKEYGVEKAREVVGGAPDKTATHYVFREIPSYYSVEFQSWYHDGEWWDSDCHTEQDLIDSYGEDYVVSLSDLKRLVESIYLVKEHCTLERAEKYADSPYTAPEIKVCLLDAIADYKSAYSNDMGDDSHVENHISPLCKVGVK